MRSLFGLFGLLVVAVVFLPTLAHAESYQYDTAGRLIQVTYDDFSRITYTYDANGNLLSSVVALDGDADGFTDGEDNCPADYNPSQIDSNLSGQGDACEEATFYVSAEPGTPGDYVTLAEAVAGVPTGSTVVLRPSATPYGGVVIDRSLTLTSEDGQPSGSTVLDGGGGTALEIVSGADFVELHGLWVVNSGVAIQMNHAGGQLFLEDTNLIDNGTGLWVLEGAVRGERLEIRRSTNSGVEVTAGSLDLHSSLVVTGNNGVMLSGTGTADLLHVTVAGQAGTGVQTTDPWAVTVDRSVVWGNVGADLVNIDASQVFFTDTGTVGYAGMNGNLSVDPLFLDPSSEDYRLQSTSPILEAGPPPQDYDGRVCRDLLNNPRGLDYDGDGLAFPDMGAYEGRDDLLTPTEVTNLQFESDGTLHWDAEGSSTRYNLFQVVIPGLSYGDFGTCVVSTVATSLPDPTGTPPLGVAFGFLVAGEDAMGQEGSLGEGTCIQRSKFFPPCP